MEIFLILENGIRGNLIEFIVHEDHLCTGMFRTD